tara:strand:+ start:30210 stop:31847 length:1638 start_codon:yes stop_codon:yes gene_type:complete
MSDPIAEMNYGRESRSGGENGWAADLDSIREGRLFHRALVIETLCDPSLRDAEEAFPETLDDTFEMLYRQAPRNAIICRIITDEAGTSEISDIIAFPFFSSHLAMPVKAGEQVWLVRESLFGDPRRGTPYWVCRVPEDLPLEDANFTAFTRQPSFYATGSVEVGPDRKLDFSNTIGPDVNVIAGDAGAIEEVILSSIESSLQTVFEPVPRLTKRPGDLVLQGSNNSTITLGMDRGFDFNERPDKRETSNSSVTPDTDSGIIDIVAGRGRYFEPDDDEIAKPRGKSEAGGEVNSTKPFVTKNTLDFIETDKDPGQTQDRNTDEENGDDGAPADPGNSLTNPSEGDPDFLVDASRIYVSEKTDIDNKLGLSEIRADGFGGPFEPVESSPCIAVKSDHIRIIARKVPNPAVEGLLPTKFESAEGTIRIVKEGDPKDDLACIYIESDGTIQITGKKIFLGRTPDDDGAGNGPGDKESQPYVKYQELEDLWKDTMKELNKFCQTLLSHVTPGYGAPSPQIIQAATDLKSAIASSLDPDIENVKSERIFGE